MKINQLKGGAALSYVTIFLTNIVGLVLTPFIIRSLGSAEYGLYTMIGALVGYMSVLDFGLNNTIIRFVAKFKAEKDKKGEQNFLAHSFIMYACISILVAIIGVIFYINIDTLYVNTLSTEQISKAKTMVLILVFNLAISLPGGAFSGICYGYEIFVLPKTINIIKYIFRSGLVILILFKGGDSISLVIMDTILNMLIIFIDAYIVFKIIKVKIKMHHYNKMMFIEILSFSIWLFIFAIVHQLRWQFGQLILGLYYSTTIVAIYAVGSTLGNYYGAFSSAISSVFLPRAIQVTINDAPKEELTTLFIKVSRVILFVLLLILGSFIVSGKDFVFFWVGDEYHMAYYYALAIMLGLTPTLSQGFANNILEAKNLLVYRGRLLLTLTVLGVIISFFVAKTFGTMEMILVTVFFLLLERAIIIPYYIKKANLDMLRYYKEIAPLFLSIGIAVILSAVNSYFLPNQNVLAMLFKLLTFSIIYFVFCLKVMNGYEKHLLKSLFSKMPIVYKIGKKL
ncbi:oligosaccharide flippase family protein [Flavobacteriaceae bacterium SZ-1-7]|uniref:lipopolysaccharide biosynthesis protein n=1 Tax=Tamlana sedimenti TaxID=3134126 RepID=UPI003120E0FB